MRYLLSIAVYTAVVASFMVLAAVADDSPQVADVFVLVTLAVLHLCVGFAIGRAWALALVLLLPLLAIPVPTATDCGDGCEPLPMWFGMLYVGIPVGLVLIGTGIVVRKLRDRRRLPEVA